MVIWLNWSQLLFNKMLHHHHHHHHHHHITNVVFWTAFQLLDYQIWWWWLFSSCVVGWNEVTAKKEKKSQQRLFHATLKSLIIHLRLLMRHLWVTDGDLIDLSSRWHQSRLSDDVTYCIRFKTSGAASFVAWTYLQSVVPTSIINLCSLSRFGFSWWATISI